MGSEPESEKYRRAAKVALAKAHTTTDEESKASWLQHYEEWTRRAEELGRAGAPQPLVTDSAVAEPSNPAPTRAWWQIWWRLLGPIDRRSKDVT
jgi:hypothetical protein